MFLLREDLKLVCVRCTWGPFGNARAALLHRNGVMSHPGGTGPLISTNCPLRLGNDFEL